jgi:hypothetical protein
MHICPLVQYLNDCSLVQHYITGVFLANVFMILEPVICILYKTIINIAF